MHPSSQGTEESARAEQSTGDQSTGDQSTGDQSTGDQSRGDLSTGEQAAATANSEGRPGGELLAGLDTLDERPLHEHAGVFEQVHARLQGALSEIDSA